MQATQSQLRHEDDDLAGESVRRRFAEHLAAALRTAGGRLEEDPSYSDRFGLDFILTRLESLHAHVHLGVRLATTAGDLEQMERFAQVGRRGVALKSLYIEADPETLETGGVLVAQGACLTYMFDGRYRQQRSSGVRLHPDASFEFFDLEDKIQRLRRVAEDASLQVGDDLEGRIIAYFTDKGFGFIEMEHNRKFFFHIANVPDEELREILPDYRPGEVIPVAFQFGGDDGQRYPKAYNVVLDDHDGDYEDDDEY